MTKMHWWRSHHGMPTATKWLVVARKAKSNPGVVSALVWALCDHASQANERGDISTFNVEDYAEWSGFDEVELKRIFDALREKGVIADNRLSDWDESQPQREDDSRDRVRAFRARKALEDAMPATPSPTEEKAPDVTHGNADVTPSNADGLLQGVTDVTLLSYLLLQEQGTLDNEAPNDLSLPALPLPVAGHLFKGTKDDPVIVSSPTAKERSARLREREIATRLRLAAMDAVSAVHVELTGSAPDLPTAKVYDAWLSRTTSAAIINALRAAEQKVKSPEGRFAYAMGILRNQEKDKSLPAPNTIIPQIPSAAAGEAWNPIAPLDDAHAP